MENYIFWIFISLPLAGFIIGSINPLGFISNKQAMIIALIISFLILFYYLTDISFSLDLLDNFVPAIGLISIGYAATGMKNSTRGFKKLILVFRAIIILFYIFIPFVLYSFLIIAFGNNWLGQTVHTDKQNNYKIDHICKYSNFTFAGYHYVHVYKELLLIEYPVDYFELGKYSEYGFNMYIVKPNGEMIPENKFYYDPNRETLILFKYKNDKYVRTKEFRN